MGYIKAYDPLIFVFLKYGFGMEWAKMKCPQQYENTFLAGPWILCHQTGAMTVPFTQEKSFSILMDLWERTVTFAIAMWLPATCFFVCQYVLKLKFGNCQNAMACSDSYLHKDLSHCILIITLFFTQNSKSSYTFICQLKLYFSNS